MSSLLCLILLHTPDNEVLRVDTKHVTAVRHVTSNIKQHLAPNVNTIIYAAGQNFGVRETAEEVEELINTCVED